MARTESITFQCHPNDEQKMIERMQLFCWNMLSSQEIKTKDSHLEQRGDSIYSVTETEHYVKLAFSRDIDAPNLKEIKSIEQQYSNLEKEYSDLKTPSLPKLFPGGGCLWLPLILFTIGIFAWPIYYFASYKPKMEAAKLSIKQHEEKKKDLEAKKVAILAQLEQYK